jgi:hypothetical protein
MLSENGLKSVCFGSHHDAVLQNTGALMSMYDVNMFPYQYLTYKWQTIEE